MSKSLQIGILVAAIVLALGFVGFSVIRGSSSGTYSTPDQRRLSDAIDATGGDLSKLSPEMKKLYDEQVKNAPGGTMQRYGNPGSVPSSATGMPTHSQGER